jgi:hypothetical protein
MGLWHNALQVHCFACSCRVIRCDRVSNILSTWKRRDANPWRAHPARVSKNDGRAPARPSVLSYGLPSASQPPRPRQSATLGRADDEGQGGSEPDADAAEAGGSTASAGCRPPSSSLGARIRRRRAHKGFFPYPSSASQSPHAENGSSCNYTAQFGVLFSPQERAKRRPESSDEGGAA